METSYATTASKNLVLAVSVGGLLILALLLNSNTQSLKKELASLRSGNLEEGSITLDKLAEEIEVPVEVTLGNGEKVKGIIVEGEVEDGEVIGDLVLQLENGDTVTWSGGLKEVPQTGEEPDTTITNVTNVTNELELADGSVTEVKIADGAISNAKLQDGIIYANNLTTDSVLAIHIKDGEVTTSEILNGTITNADISNTASVDWTKISKVGSSIADLDSHDAVDVDIADSGGYFTGTDVETALQELGATAFSGAYVLKAGDTMTGELIIEVSTAASEALTLNSTDGSLTNPLLQLQNAGTPFIQAWPTASSDGTKNFLRVQGTLPTTYAEAAKFNFTSSGSDASGQVGALVTLNTGYTGTGATYALSASNTVTSGELFGIQGYVGGGTTGTQIGVKGHAQGGQALRIGVQGLSNSAAGASTVNIGVMGAGRAGSTGPAVGGWFTIKNIGFGYNTPPSGALVADNDTTAHPIFLGLDNTTTVFTIADGGAVTNTVTTASLIPLTVKGAASQTANLAEFQNSSGTPYVFIGPRGQTEVDVATATDKGLILKSTDNSTTNDLLELEDSAGTRVVSAHTAVATDNSHNFLRVAGTMPTTPTATIAGVRFVITSAGSNSFSRRGLDVTMGAGYTGGSSTVAVNAVNSVAGTGNNIASATGNFGLVGNTSNTTTGLNVGGIGIALNGTTNIGLFGRTITGTNATNNIGVLGLSNDGANGTTAMVGGYFALDATPGTFSSAALIANNSATTAPIFLGQDNGTTTFIIEDGGNVGINTNDATNALDVNSNAIRIRTPRTPATSGDTCTQGEISWDTDYMYVCVATNTWKRTSITTW